jgi:hypothetical protein
MLKRLLLPSALLLAMLAPASAFASFVCRAEYFPGIPRIKLITTESTNCVGTTKTWWVCDPTSTSTACGSLRYTPAELLNLQSSLASAGKTQQSVLVSTIACGTSTCFYSAAFSY